MSENTPVQRRLAAILAADVVGYSRLMGGDEEGTLALLKALRAEVIDPSITEHRGRSMSPFDPLWADWLHYLGRAYYHVGDYPAAVATARRLLQSHPDFRSAYLTLIAGSGELGQPEEAQRAMAEGRRRFGDDFFTRLARRPPEVRIEDHEHLLASLRKTGVLDRTAR